MRAFLADRPFRSLREVIAVFAKRLLGTIGRIPSPRRKVGERDPKLAESRLPARAFPQAWRNTSSGHIV
jgi:hypothetical protein